MSTYFWVTIKYKMVKLRMWRKTCEPWKDLKFDDCFRYEQKPWSDQITCITSHERNVFWRTTGYKNPESELVHLLGCSGVHPDPELSRIFCVDQLFADFLINFRRFFARIYVIYVTFELRDSEISCISKYHEQQYDCILWAIFLTKYLHCKNAIKFVLEGGGSYKGGYQKNC